MLGAKYEHDLRDLVVVPEAYLGNIDDTAFYLCKTIITVLMYNPVQSSCCY